MKRSNALDSLRGLAIIGMVLSGTISSGLPAWMYHAQVGPRSAMKFDPSIPGITWVDLVFPFFLFAMGAAFPLALTPKLERGATLPSLLPALLKRFCLLAFFAIAIYHTTPYRVTGEWNFLLAVISFALFFMSFVRLPSSKGISNSILNSTGLVLLLALIAFNVVGQPEVFKQGFKVSHSDVILLILANMALFGAVIWLITRRNITLRLAVMACLVALKLSAEVEGSWTRELWNFNPMQWLPDSLTAFLYTPGGWLYRMEFLMYLLIVLPGTIAGDLILNRMKESEQNLPSDRRKMTGLLFVSIALISCNIVGLYNRWLVPNLLLTGLLISSGFLLLRSPRSSLSKKYLDLFGWGTGWLLVGLILEAYEGGIRKDPATLSYFFASSGLAIFTYLFFSVISDYFNKGKRISYITECGQNPMLAYVAGTFVMVPLLVYTGLMPLINQLPGYSPWLGLVKGLVITGGMMVLTIISVRKKLFWKT